MTKRGFTISENGLTFIGVGIGTTLASIINHLATAHYPALIKKWRGFPPPEGRLYGAMIGSPVLVIGIFLLGWTGQYPSIPWYVPAISTIFVGAGIGVIFMSFLVRITSAVHYPYRLIDIPPSELLGGNISVSLDFQVQ